MVTDTSEYAIAAILLQPGEDPAKRRTEVRYSVAFHSRKLRAAQGNYEVHDKELLAIVDTFRQWRRYLEGSRHPVIVQMDHLNLKYFRTAKTLNSRQARWTEKLAAYDFVIEYRLGTSNPADAPSRRPDYKTTGDEEPARLLPMYAAAKAQSRVVCQLLEQRSTQYPNRVRSDGSWRGTGRRPGLLRSQNPGHRGGRDGAR